jgi:hypothetical protein
LARVIKTCRCCKHLRAAQGVVAGADRAYRACGGGEDLVGQAVQAVVAEDFVGVVVGVLALGEVAQGVVGVGVVDDAGV